MKKVKIFKTEKEFIKYLRLNGDENYNNASDEYLVDEAFTQHWVSEDYYNETGYYKIINEEELY